MALFREKLYSMVPVIKKKYVKENGFRMFPVVEIEGRPEEFYTTPYLKEIKEFCETIGYVAGKRVFLVTDNEMLGIKAAFGIMNYPIYES